LGLSVPENPCSGVGCIGQLGLEWINRGIAHKSTSQYYFNEVKKYNSE
jgi:hypothetical protein